MEKSSYRLFYSLFSFGIVFLTACSTTYQGNIGENENVLEPSPTVRPDLMDEKDNTTDEQLQIGPDQSLMETNLVPTQTFDPSLKIAEESTELQEIKTEIIATNPESVNLLSGDLQFIEFFAYW